MRANPTEQLEASVTDLGSRGYCDLAAFVLRELYPDAPLYRVTDAAGIRFAHVFLRVGERELDIDGFCPHGVMLRLFWEDGFRIEETSAESVETYFLGRGRELDETRNITQRFRDHIHNNPDQFSPPAQTEGSPSLPS